MSAPGRGKGRAMKLLDNGCDIQDLRLVLKGVGNFGNPLIRALLVGPMCFFAMEVQLINTVIYMVSLYF